MSTKSNSNSASIASKTLALAIILGLGPFGLLGGTGAALGAPASDTATASANTTEVIKLANGKTRIRVDLADNLRGKTVVITTTRLVNGKAVKVTLGKVTLNKKGRAVLTVSKKIRVDDRLIVSDGVKNIVNSKITVIDDKKTVVPVPTPTPPASGGGSSSSSPSAPTPGAISRAATTPNSAVGAQVDTITLSGTYEVGDTILIGGVANTPIYFTVASASAVADEILAQVNFAPGHTVTAAKTSATEVTFTADVPGTAFTATVTAGNGGSDNTQAASLATTTPNRTSVAQIDTITLSGTFAVGDTITITGVAVADVVITVASASAVADEIVAAVNAATGHTVTAAKTSATEVTLTADVPGTAFTATVAKS